MSAWLASGGADLGAGARQQVDDAARHVAGGEHLGQVEAGEREPLRHQRDDHVAARQRRAERLDQARQRRLVGRHEGDDADRLGHAEGEVRLRDLVDAAQHAGQLVGPARVVHGGLDAGGQLGAGGLGRHARGGGDDARQLVGAGLQHLGQAVEDLAAVVRGAAAPRPERGPRGAHGVAGVLARGQRRVGEVLAGRRR